MALLREALTEIIEDVGVRTIGINMQYVKYIPSGFFGMLFDLDEKRGVRVYLYSPQPNVQQMLWFRQFMMLQEEGYYLLDCEPAEQLVPQEVPAWAEGESVWNAETEETLLPTTHFESN